MLQQQERFDEFRDEFNLERPHEAIKLRPPAKLYKPSAKTLPAELVPLDYPLHDDSRPVSSSGSVYVNGKTFFLSSALAGEFVGLREVDPGRWDVSFMHYELGRFDEASREFSQREIVL